jgi:methyl-accepting chemotaxis protein
MTTTASPRSCSRSEASARPARSDISKRVEAIQADTAGAVDAIGRISTVIGEINDFQATIATAVEEQTATTNEMNRNVAGAADGTQGIAAAISGLAAGTQETSQRVADAQRAAGELARRVPAGDTR